MRWNEAVHDETIKSDGLEGDEVDQERCSPDIGRCEEEGGQNAVHCSAQMMSCNHGSEIGETWGELNEVHDDDGRHEGRDSGELFPEWLKFLLFEVGREDDVSEGREDDGEEEGFDSVL